MEISLSAKGKFICLISWRGIQLNKRGRKGAAVMRFYRMAAAVSFVLFCGTAQASILGTITGDSWQTDMGGGAVYTHNVFSSPSVGLQTENYVEYAPNTDSVPIVVNGASVWGKRTITAAADYMTKNNLRPLIGINADYFSFKTGIPMGYTIIDGKIYSKETGIQDAVGFRSDGTAFIDKLGINTSLTHNAVKIPITYINKWSQDGFGWVYLLTDDFGSSTHTDYNALYVICTPTEGELAINTEMTLRVDDVFIKSGSISIPPGCFVFVMDPDGEPAYVDMLSKLAVGDTLTLANSVYGAERYDWTEARFAASSIGGRLINNGVLGSGFTAGAAPRTAVGVKGDGNVIFYTLDGRQSGYSYGAQLKTLAERMRELGCVDAINFDGGGSTAIGAIFPGSSVFTVTNRPSEGALRSCANYLFLQDMRKNTNDPWYVTWSMPVNHNYLAGTTISLTPTAVYDTGNFKMDGLKNVSFSVENTKDAKTTVDDSGFVTLKGTGHSVVSVTGKSYHKTFSFEVYETPDEIRIFDEATGKSIEGLSVTEGGMAEYDLEAGAYVNNVRLEAFSSLFRWSVEGTLARVDEDGRILIKDDGSENAALKTTAGGRSKEIPITVTEEDSFCDISAHWAHDIIEQMSDDGIINGIAENGKLLFKPDDNISRIQFAAIMCKAMGIDQDKYSDDVLNFTDNDQIQPWAVNYVKAMVSMGYINGKSDDNGKTLYFDPESSISRAEAFAVMARTIDSDETQILTYSDTSAIPQWAQPSFARLAALGIIQGFSDNSIKPNACATRAEAAVLVSKLTAL